MVDYVLRHGTEEECRRLDAGSPAPTVIYRTVHTRVTGEDHAPGRNPKEFVRMARAAARAAFELFDTAGEPPALGLDEI
ncbi:MAG TPA: hypothetical protein VF546_04670 [Pyrinomonadaceae bacterium]